MVKIRKLCFPLAKKNQGLAEMSQTRNDITTFTISMDIKIVIYILFFIKTHCVVVKSNLKPVKEMV